MKISDFSKNLKKVIKLNVEFAYNKTFSGGNKYPEGGSWTLQMRPDYSLSIWPAGLTADQAEREELIVHIHFDAKYKIDNLNQIFRDTTDNLEIEEEEEQKGIYKNADLMKMHTYRDAIRRTAGAYVFYIRDLCLCLKTNADFMKYFRDWVLFQLNRQREMMVQKS